MFNDLSTMMEVACLTARDIYYKVQLTNFNLSYTKLENYQKALLNHINKLSEYDDIPNGFMVILTNTLNYVSEQLFNVL